MSADSGPVGRREVAYRLFAAEYEDADLEVSDSDEERAPNYVVTPAGARVNRLFVVGVLTEVEPVSDDVLRARVVDPTGAFVVYAGQYQPEAVAFLDDADVPSFVSLTGKARTFQPDGSDRVFTSVRPESLTAVDSQTRDRWTVQAAEHTLARVATMARAFEREERGDALVAVLEDADVAPGLATGIALAIDHYGTTLAYLAAIREQAVAAAAVVTGEREAVPDLELAADDAGPVEADLTAAPAVPGTLGAEAKLRGDPVPDQAPTATVDADEAPPEPPEAAELEPEPSTELDATEPDDDLGDFEAGDVTADVSEGAEGPDERYELDDEEREQVEAEFGTEFSTGSEVGEPGEAGIEPETEPPATEPAAEPAEPLDAEPDEAESEPVVAETEPGATATEASLEDAAVEAMAELDEGDGADHEAVVEAVVEAHGAEAAAVEDAIQDALMGGRCYEPADGRLKAI